MIKFNMLIVVMLGTLLLFSCGKEKEEEINVPLSTLLAGTESKTWVITAYSYNGNDLFSGQKECKKDEHHIFRSNGILDIYPGPTKCSDEADELISTSNWSINEAKKEFTWNVTYKILTLTEDKFVFEYTDAHTQEVTTMEAVN